MVYSVVIFEKGASKMVSKRNWLGILAVLLVFGTVFLGCPNDTTDNNGSNGGGGGDTWSDVTSFEQLDGTWRGSYSESMTMEEMMTEDEITWTDEMQTMFGDMNITISMDITSTFNVVDKTSAMSTTFTETYSGGNIETMWITMKQDLAGINGITFDDTTHSITMTENQPTAPMTDEDIEEMLDSGLKINQNGTRVKIPANAMDEGLPEIIMVKQ
jgi:hypothetical protein